MKKKYGNNVYLNIRTCSRTLVDFINEEKKRWYIFTSICILFLSTIIWFFIMNSKLNNIISDREDTINSIVDKTVSLKREGKKPLSKNDITIYIK